MIERQVILKEILQNYFRFIVTIASKTMRKHQSICSLAGQMDRMKLMNRHEMNAS